MSQVPLVHIIVDHLGDTDRILNRRDVAQSLWSCVAFDCRSSLYSCRLCDHEQAILACAKGTK